MNAEYFDALVAACEEDCKTFTKGRYKNFWNSIVDKYSEQAHFVYELLQNANDAEATYARFILFHDKLIFAHNGKRHFSVSDPETEEMDRENGNLGDVNSITSIAFSTKTDEDTIGKFGVGFKAVFQYTSTPYIYDSDIKFKIERYIIPRLLENDHPERKNNETLFEFPFDHIINNADVAFKAISERLSALVNPILFLPHLQEIKFSFDNTVGYYKKKIIREYVFGDTVAELVQLSAKINDKTDKIQLWLFSRCFTGNIKYCVGFKTNDKGKLVPYDGQSVYCYFPTKKQTGLKFIIHAPFLLTDSREGIKDDPHNTLMIDLLSELAADSLVYLRDISEKEGTRLLDDNIIKIVPLPPSYWSGLSINSEIKPYYEKMLRKFQTERIIPTTNSYCYAEEAYWAQDSGIIKVFNEKILKQLTGNEEAQWAFTSLKYDKTSGEEDDYITNIVSERLSNNDILNYIDEDTDFIIGKSIAWLASFYKWTKKIGDISHIRRMHIFFDTDENAVPAYNSEDKPVLFLPTNEKSDYTTVSPKLLKKAEIKTFLVDDIRITMPSLKDEIYAKIIPQIKNGDSFDSGRVFKKFFSYYYKECSAWEQSNFIQTIKIIPFIKSIMAESKKHFLCTPNTLYFPDETLREYFKVIPDTYFVDFEAYLKLLGKEMEKPLRDFLLNLGVSEKIKFITNSLNWWNGLGKYSDYSWKESTRDEKWTEQIIIGCSENIFEIVNKKEFTRSVLLWKIILKILEDNNYSAQDLENRLRIKHEYFYRKSKKEYKDSINVLELRNEQWLRTKSGKFVSPSETFAAALADEYDINSPAARHFIEFLKMPFEDPKLSNLTSEQRTAVENDIILKQYGINSKEELIRLLEDHKNIVSANNSDSRNDVGSAQDGTSTPEHHSNSKKKINRSRTLEPENSDDVDSDEFTPKTIDYKKKIARAKAKSDAEIDLIEQMEELQQKAIESKKYTFGWFKALLDLESFNDSENRSNSREVSISFGKVELENPSGHTLVLKQPSSYIPQFMEELADIPLILEFEKDTKKLPIEVINIRSFTLRVKIKPNYDISKIPFNEVKEARITAQSPAFLLEELKNQLTKLPFADDFDMKTNLCDNIEFVFGPPGTGKTTYLANEVLIPLMKQKKKCKVLVLTPTNKAADVIALKIIEVMGNDSSYKDWLVRFGSTNDDDIEKAVIFKDKDFDLSAPDKLITITTIDRFPYDFFMPNGERHYIRNQKYDYIVFDEASMIPLVKIIYPLYHRTPEKFIIAGDPFQIEPVVSLDMWKGENIYKMVKLDSFANPKTVPHKYEVKLLTKQYRSIPAIGKLFSMMTYDGILEHHRKSTDQGVLDFGNKLNVQSLNIIKFPVKKYESIYRSKRLGNKTPYHIYSALFTYEFTLWLANTIHKNNPDKNVRIGVISAYKAQADLIDRLISSADIPDTISVQTGTIHGFQGDECELIITVYNTPPSISDKKNMFLNKKNIINVSISRARDYLFVLMPDDDTENIENLKLIKPMEQYIKESTDYSEYNSHEIEQIIFGNSEYIEENSFSTGHQNVNVYGTPEQKYEIRSENDAIDVQLHK